MSHKSNCSSTVSVDDEWLDFLNNTEYDNENEYDNYENTFTNNETMESNEEQTTCDGPNLYTFSNNKNKKSSSVYSDNINTNHHSFITLNDLNKKPDLSTSLQFLGVPETETSDVREAPVASDIYISTKSKISYLNQEIDIKNIFWKVPIISYFKPENGIIKKQIKFNSNSEEELNIIKENLKNEVYYKEEILTSINNPYGRIKFKDIRKVSVGICKKDIINECAKKKSVFYNCFVIILRYKSSQHVNNQSHSSVSNESTNETFKEYHIKIFNTGKIEIPGVQNDEIFKNILKIIIEVLQPHITNGELLNYKQSSDTILINSNFNCGFFINREELVDILKYKYNVHSIYDPTSYPGIQCKFYYDLTTKTHTSVGSKDYKKSKNIVEVSFMIFRTGSILIVGMCEEYILHIIYSFLTEILKNEYSKICQKSHETYVTNKKKTKKVKMKNIQISVLPTITEE
jgi:hypothetical protein